MRYSMGVVADGFEKHASFEERTRALQVTADAMRASVRIVADAPYGGSVADQFVDLIGRSLDRPCRIVEGPSPDIDGQQDLLLPIPSPTDGQLWLAIESGPRLELADWEMELAQLLAVQLGAALNLQQSTATKQRADELALANRALSRTVYRLASKPDLDAVLGHVLLESSTHLGADAAQLTIYDAERDVLVTAAAAQDGALLDKHELPHEQPRQSCPFFDRLIERGGPSLFDPMREPELFWSDSLDFHRRREHTIVLACPILLDRVILGHIVLAYKNPDDVPDTSSELVNALTTQAGLAIYLTRLADQAQQQAVTAEREQAAVLRAAELSKVSRLLVESLRELSASSDPEEFLEHALRSLAHAIGATNIHLFSYDAERDTLCLRLTYVDGWVRRGPDGSELPLFAAPFPTKITRAWELMVSDRGLYTLKTTSTPAQDFAWPGAVERLRQIGASDYGHMVLFMGDQPVGSLGLEFTNGRKLSEGDRPLLAALAQQMAIALRLADISKYAREAITARERAHTAQLKVA
ncbi:MAG TPA: GAF domain-containing protein, partial [Bryobacteraceae bacterium]|nr:GAF domain-containing protein [Bryobacteraceae bacterium]